VTRKAWWTTVTETRGRAELSGSVGYEYLYLGNVVNIQSVRSLKHGARRPSLDFPAAAVGEPLLLPVVVKTRYGRVVLNRPFRARE
jgi:hypothetical protein